MERREDHEHDLTFYAHSLPAPHAQALWQLLSDHLKTVGSLAAEFAGAFSSDSLAEAAGLLHDLGKYTAAFQSYIRGSKDRVDHSTWGARIALERYGSLGYLLAYAIAGHHAGLANGSGEGERTNLKERLAASLPAELPVHVRYRNADLCGECQVFCFGWHLVKYFNKFTL